MLESILWHYFYQMPHFFDTVYSSEWNFLLLLFNIITKLKIIISTEILQGGAVSCGTALQAGRSRVLFPILSLEFFIEVILSAALWHWGSLSLLQKCVKKSVPLQARGAQRVPGSYGSQISWQRHRMVVRLSALHTGRLYPRKCSWYSFLLEAESTPGP